MGMRLAIVTPVRSVVDTEADLVVAPGSEGELGILPGHAPLLVALKPGVVSYDEGGRTTRMVIGGGFAEVTQDHVTVLATSAEAAEKIDAGEAEARRAKAAAALDEAGFAAPPELLAKLRTALDLAQARVDAVVRH